MTLVIVATLAFVIGLHVGLLIAAILASGAREDEWRRYAWRDGDDG